MQDREPIPETKDQEALANMPLTQFQAILRTKSVTEAETLKEETVVTSNDGRTTTTLPTMGPAPTGKGQPPTGQGRPPTGKERPPAGKRHPPA